MADSAAQGRPEGENAQGTAQAPQGLSQAASGVQRIPLPRQLGRLILLKQLARGGMGDVYLAATTGIEGAERPCVVKTVRSDHIHDGSFLARFLDEARVQAQLNHPGVAQVLEATTDDNGEPYTVIEHIEGRSLADLRQRAVQVGARVGWPEAVALTVEMAHALAHVHERAGLDGTPLGIVHRDLSPQNIMVGYAGEIKLIDFGTARGHNRRCHTVAGVVFAKPGYVAPEVARQQVGDGRIDIYAIGVMLWELCAGKRLLSGDPQKHLEEVAQGRFSIPQLSKVRGIPARIDEIIAKLCASDPDERYTSAQTAATDLAKVLGQAPVGKNGERSVRARIAMLMRTLWPDEPAKSRAEFARLLRDARKIVPKEEGTPPASDIVELARSHMAGDPTLLPGTPYRLGNKLGEGASGVVYEAEHTGLGRKVALKVLDPSYTSAQDAVERFRREARCVANLQHPNLAFLHDFGKALDGRLFLAMELLSGHTLDKRTDRVMPFVEAVDLCVEVSHALECAHAAGLVHRDLKPQNLFITDSGTVKLLDFGIAMAQSETHGSEEPKQKGFCIFGTPEYMAPEQVAGDPVDARCDVYALGCVLYDLLTGAPPFEGPSSVVVMGKQLRETPVSPRSRVPGLPVELEAVVMRALAKKREDRFANVVEMRQALLLARGAQSRRKTRGKIVTSLVAAACLGILGVASFQQLHKPQIAAHIPTVSVDSLPTANVAPMSAPAPAETTAVTPVAPAQQDAPTEAPSVVTESVAPKASAAKVAAAAAGTTQEGADAPAPEVEDKPSKSATVPVGGRAAVHAVRLVEARERAKSHPQETKALRAWALSAYRAGDYTEAARAAEQWGERDGSVEPKLMLATALDAQGRKGEAKMLLEDWIRQNPSSPEAKRLLARLKEGKARR